MEDVEVKKRSSRRSFPSARHSFSSGSLQRGIRRTVSERSADFVSGQSSASGKLLGCCLENKGALLVFEFVPNGTLSEILHGKKDFRLSWKQRLEISMQIADALNYLHSVPIVHRDVKSANILLTEKLKVADFGISKLGFCRNCRGYAFFDSCNPRNYKIHRSGVLHELLGDCKE